MSIFRYVFSGALAACDGDLGLTRWQGLARYHWLGVASMGLCVYWLLVCVTSFASWVVFSGGFWGIWRGYYICGVVGVQFPYFASMLIL